VSTYVATVDWRLDGAFQRGRYSRAHTLRFDGGVEIRGSSAPSVVPLPWSAEDAVDPEEMLVASLSACHMLTFLDIARRAGWSIDRYVDVAEGTMEKTAEGRMWVAKVVLRPDIGWVGDAPSPTDLEALHHQAHETCFIANSVKAEVVVELPQPLLSRKEDERL
jgi:organic hydroperoxide reductase OsmC/OhrA